MPKIIVQKHQWIDLGYKLFAKHGVSGIVVEKMADKLKCNKSSFYWHFKTKKEFIHALIEFWIAAETEQIIYLTEKLKNPEEKLNQFLKVAFKKEPYLEFIFFLKRYAIQHTEVQVIVDDIDRRRIDFTAALLQENGYSKPESRIKAKIFYNYLIGYHEMMKNKKQPKNYLVEVKEELKHFLEL